MQGYWNDPELTARVFRKGRSRADTLLYSGDLFKTDADGYLYFVSRNDDLLKVKEERISPKEIEDTILSVEGVSEAAAAVWSNDNFMKFITAFVVTSPAAALDSQALLSHCQQHLEDHMVPKNFFFVSRLPKTVNGKIDRKALDRKFVDRNPAVAALG
jgi:acyl-coenzyme A synthetase/AMP-(fatty) acid ligase